MPANALRMAPAHRVAPLYSAAERIVLIQGVHWNLNLRELHDSIYGEPRGAPVRFVFAAGALILSRSTALPAVRTGPWPSMSGYRLIQFGDPGVGAKGRFQGRGGNGGAGGSAYISGAFFVADPGGNGGAGGDALLVEAPTRIDAAHGEIWGGGGGSGGGGAGVNDVFPDIRGYGGAAGGPGAGTDPGSIAAGGTGQGGGNGSASGPATAETGGVPGSPAAFGGSASAGGAPGQNGTNGTAGTGNTTNGAGGIGGTAGRYVVGNAFVTWIAAGDVRGGVAA